MNYVFDLDLPQEVKNQVEEMQQAKVANIERPLSPSKLTSNDGPASRQIVVGYMDIDPLTAAETGSRSNKTGRGTHGIHWLS